ncbi:MAG TPA: energy transducer TonB [Syntrophales bacterium]|nr:energy transducer TonB [Syntrophales bacterium]
MSSKKIIILSVVISLIGHALLISAAGLVDIRLRKEKKESIITVNMEEISAPKYRANDKNRHTVVPLSLATEIETGDELSENWENTVELDSPDKEYAAYLKKIKRKIENIWSYPRQAFEREKEGTSTVKFSLDKSGKLLASRVIKSSGYDLLDKETISAIRAAAPYESFPPDINFSRLHILATFHYSLLK